MQPLAGIISIKSNAELKKECKQKDLMNEKKKNLVHWELIVHLNAGFVSPSSFSFDPLCFCTEVHVKSVYLWDHLQGLLFNGGLQMLPNFSRGIKGEVMIRIRKQNIRA